MSLAVRSLSSSLSASGPLDEPVLERSQSGSILSQKRIKVLLPQEEKMHNNFLEALSQHGLTPDLLPHIELKPALTPMQLACSATSVKGPVRPSMEDAHFDMVLPEGHLIGIFDGHGEKGRIARQVSTIFQKHFQSELEKTPDDIRRVFIDLCQRAQSEITDTSGGTTALVVYFHNASNRFYTATLGDSEMRIYRKIGDDIISIPVSLVRDWKSDKDCKRFLDVVDNEEVKQEWLKEQNPKMRRFPPPSTVGGRAVGINTSRSLGDLRMLWKGETAVGRKPKVSMTQAADYEGVQDKVVFACDGLWDFANEQQLIDTVLKPFWNDPNLSEHIVQYAIHTAKSLDNVTVMVGSLSKEGITPALSRTATIVLDAE